MIVPPYCSFHCHARATNASRPSASRLVPFLRELLLDDVLRRDAGVVGARAGRARRGPRMRSNRMITSCSVLLSACPMWSAPVTFGGGITITNGLPPGRASGLNEPDSSHARYQRSSTAAGA